ncbi:hypothetical protein CLOM_g3099, partial [Closterium sp. NIES-68]
MVATRMLHNLGIKYDLVENGRLALSACEARKYEVVLMKTLQKIPHPNAAFTSFAALSTSTAFLLSLSSPLSPLPPAPPCAGLP